MGFFKDEQKKDKELENARKYVETFNYSGIENLDKEIARRSEAGRIIKDIKIHGTGGRVTILYDTWAEKARNEKENSKEIEL